eukprot:1049097-Pelagomonas_calceolata.AAC.1
MFLVLDFSTRCPDTVLVIPMKKKGEGYIAVPAYEGKCQVPVPVEKERGRRGNREHSAPATVTTPASKVLHPSQLLPDLQISYIFTGGPSARLLG